MREKIKQAHALGKKAAYSKSFRRYIFVGVSTVVLDYLLLFFFRSILSLGLALSVTTAYWISIGYNFLMNRYFSFQASEGLVPKQMILYGCLLFFNYLVTILIVFILESIGVSEYIAKMLALGVTVTWTYLLYKRIVFVVR